MHTEHVYFRNIILPVFISSVPISLYKALALGCRICVDALTLPSPLSLTSEDPKVIAVNPQIPLFSLIFSSIYANVE